jgi:hypothetical protein
VGSRQWRVAFHSYPPNLLAPDFSPLDFPKVTFGNLGVLAGWLRQTFPSSPHAWEIQLTENGINALAPSSPALQASQLCAAFENVLGTPGIESFIYHRMRDHSAETAAGLGLGLRDESGNARPAWATWALANRNDQLSCGFQHLPWARLTRSHHATQGHWVSTRRAPAGFTAESSYRIERESKPGTTLLYECQVGAHNLLSPALDCEGQTMLGPVGWVHTSQQPGMVPLYRCRVGAGQDHFVSTSATCEGQVVEQQLGWVLP